MAEAMGSGYASRLRAHLEEFDRTRADAVVDEYLDDILRRPEPPDPDLASQIVKILRGHRRFAPLQRVADVLRQLGVSLPEVRISYAQALIEEGLLVAARTVLEMELASAVDDELGEIEGLLGRVHKQMFMRAGEEVTEARSALLTLAVEHYLRAYRAGIDNLWPGTNAAGLLLLGARNGLSIPGWPEPAEAARQIARDILTALARPDRPSTEYDRVIALEANLALDHVNAALEQFKHYFDSAPNAFRLAGLIRQLKEVWQLQSDRMPGSMMIPPLQTKLLLAEGGALPLEPADLRAGREQSDGRHEGFERVFGLEDFEEQDWFETMLQRCRAVARVETEKQDEIGTGFLVSGKVLNPEWPEIVFVTNEHVLSDDRPLTGLVVAFRGLEQPVFAGIVRRLRSSPRTELDFAVVELDTVPAAVSPCPIAEQFPSLPVPPGEPPHRLYVIGHPLGTMTLRISIHDNLLLDYDTRVAHYRSPTEKGNSGSPVFDRTWSVVALHHAGSRQKAKLHGSGTYEANEGIRLDAIIVATASDPG